MGSVDIEGEHVEMKRCSRCLHECQPVMIVVIMTVTMTMVAGGGWCDGITLDMKDLDAHVDYRGVLVLFLSCSV